MQISERRKKILDIFEGEEFVSYKEILEATSKCGGPIDILSDLDTLISFRFLQHTKPHKKSELEITAQLELRPETKKQMKDNPQRIAHRLKEIEHENPPWYRKLAILTVLDHEMELDQIFKAVCDQYPYVKWSRTLVESSLKMLAETEYVRKEKKGETERYAFTSNGKSLLEKSPFQQLATLGRLKDEFTTEFRTFEILKLVKDDPGITSGEITRHFQSKYGKRGNKRRTIKNTLKNMTFSGLLRAKEGAGGRHKYHLGKTARSLMERAVMLMENHDIQDFRKTVHQFFNVNKILGLNRGDKSSIEQILDDLEQCRLDLSSQLPEEWAAHIMFLADHLRAIEATTWEKRAFQNIIACILSRLLPPEIGLNILKDYPPPYTPSEEQRLIYMGIAAEYYSRLTEAYLDLGRYEKAFQSFDQLEFLSWEFYGFFILKGRITILKCDMRNIHDVQGVLDAFKNALRLSKGKGRIIPLFYIGLVQYQRGNLKEPEPKTKEEREKYGKTKEKMKPKMKEEKWLQKGAKEIWESCIELGCTVNQEIIVRHNLADVYWALGDLERARENFERNIILADVPGKEEFRFKSLVGLANVLIDLCSWDEAEEKLRETIHECAGKFPLIVAIAKTNLGVLLTRKGKNEEALACHEEALQVIDKECTQEYSTILINKADTLRYLKRANEAMEALEEAETLVGKGSIALSLALEISKANILIDMGDLEEGWRLSRSVLQEAWLDDKRSETEAKRIQGTILYHKNRFYEAKGSLEKSEHILSTLGLKYELLDIYTLLEKCCQNLNSEKEKNYREKKEKLLTEIRLSD